MKILPRIILIAAIFGAVFDQTITSNCESPFKSFITPILGSKAINDNPVPEKSYCSTEFNLSSLSA